MIKEGLLSVDSLKLFKKFSSSKRKKEFLYTRMCLKSLGINDDQLLYTPQGKPFLSNSSQFISISHSKQSIAIALSNREIGVDIEEVISNRILSLTDKFLTEREKEIFIDLRDIHIAWGAKESIYKAYGKGGISIKDDINLSKFPKGILTKEKQEIKYDIHTRIINDKNIVLAIEELDL
ncbi:siderophore biosynthesis regulatory protein [Ichthyobacterium seriolicida]|uniref:Siderophore biosynthesis regulatory protein n=2 Tax=Ichthyobacterium seriolicida TaxID=242600 RepID=A0A1J1E4K9_9FLAO|nr:siderophore biosynthesis regulatory protein [Ichthyobacterium seriolicida]